MIGFIIVYTVCTYSIACTASMCVEQLLYYLINRLIHLQLQLEIYLQLVKFVALKCVINSCSELWVKPIQF